MKVAIIGGKLQGIEACYLARCAGYESILIDVDPNVPARGLADIFVAADVCARDEAALDAMRSADFVLPTNENDALLKAIVDICRMEGLKLAFDPGAYGISSSKMASDRLFQENGIPCPRHFPQGRAPYIGKPSEGSGSSGVTMLDSRRVAEGYRRTHPGHIIQEYIEGPSYSIEVIGVPGSYRTYQVTDIHVDQGYDCYKVTAPSSLPEEAQRQFSDIAVKLAELVELRGIMDVEAIYDGKSLWVLEIDARLPSQTPAAVLESTGVNFLRELAEVTLGGRSGGGSPAATDVPMDGASRTGLPADAESPGGVRYACYEHYVRRAGKVYQTGEHCMAGAGALSLRDDFPGARIAITDLGYAGCGDETCAGQELPDFRGIFINSGGSAEEVEEWRNTLLRKLKGSES